MFGSSLFPFVLFVICIDLRLVVSITILLQDVSVA